jgi:hypothetical protein
MFVKDRILKQAGPGEDYEWEITVKTDIEDFKRWGLCDECEQRLTGRSSTSKPRNLICLGCAQAAKRSI